MSTSCGGATSGRDIKGSSRPALVGAFNQEKALVGAFSVIVKTDCETDGSFHSTSGDPISIPDLRILGQEQCRQVMERSPLNNKYQFGGKESQNLEMGLWLCR